jgi:GxxExxY protein
MTSFARRPGSALMTGSPASVFFLADLSNSTHPCYSTMTELLFKELTSRIIRAYYNVYNGTGRNYSEFVYERALRRDLQDDGIVCPRQMEHRIRYKEWFVGIQILDLLPFEEVIVEIKVAARLTALHKAQTFSYLRAFGKRIGLLFNFGSPAPEFERIYFEPRPSTTSPDSISKTATELPPGLIAPDLAYEIIGGLYEVHTVLGPGFIHRIYANASFRELQARGLPVQAQKEMQVIYRGEPIAGIKFAHLRVGSGVLVFPVAVSDLSNISYNNLKAWMRVEGIPLGIVANFHDLALKPVILKA